MKGEEKDGAKRLRKLRIISRHIRMSLSFTYNLHLTDDMTVHRRMNNTVVIQLWSIWRLIKEIEEGQGEIGLT